jgi:hypothetical protein
MDESPVYVYHVVTPEGTKHYVALLPPSEIVSRGLPAEAIVGVLLRPLREGERITPEVFARNRAFVEFLHGTIARRGPSLPGLIAAAKQQWKGWVYIIDQRTRTPDGSVPLEDIVGAFEVKDGMLVPESYHPFSEHMILSADGFFRLGAELQGMLMQELANLS